MKKIIITTLLLVSTAVLFAQQLPQYSAYYNNKYIINPASAGEEESFEGKLSYRTQWEGITDAPRTYVLSVNGPTKEGKVGVGGYVFSDHTGPSRRTGGYLSYAYKLDITNDMKLSMGLSAGVLQFTLDGSKINLTELENIFDLENGVRNRTFFDAGLGLLLSTSDYYVGIAAPQLLQNKLNFFKDGVDAEGQLASHLFLMAGYNYVLNDDFSFEPSVLMKYVAPVPMQLEVGVKTTYQEQVSLSALFRSGDAISIGVGYLHDHSFSINCSYDVTTSNLKNYSTGSHEITVGVRF